MKEIGIKSPSFENNGYMPKKHTGFGEDVSPEFQLSNICDEAISIAIIMDDLDIPLIKAYNHWLIWNIPKTETIPENIAPEPYVSSFYNAIQGIAYGINKYRGPKQPVFVRNTHRYVFRFYILDCFLSLDCNAKKKDLLKAMSGHIIQQGSITGKYKR